MRLHDALVTAVNESMIPRFHTKVEELLPKMPEKASGEQIAAMLRNNGVTPDEIKWTKLDSLLKQPKVTKGEIVKHLEDHGLAFAPVDHTANFGARYQRYALQGGKNYAEKTFNLEKPAEQYPLRWDKLAADEIEAQSTKIEYRGYIPTASKGGKNGPIYDGNAEVWMATANGGKYKVVKGRVDTETRHEGDRWEYVYERKITDDSEIEPALEEAKAACQKRYNNVAALNDDGGKNYKSSHWSGANPLFHIRHQEFTDADGKNLWLVEEIQSDWHQEGRKKGYKGSHKAEIKHVPTDSHPHQVHIGGEFISGHKTKEEAEASAAEIEPRWNQNNGVPDAPMKKTWEEMAFKWALHQAVEANADRIGWVTGDIAAERFDISKSIDNLDVRKVDSAQWEATDPAKRKVHVFASKNNSDVISRMVKLDELDTVIGKDLAKKVAKDLEARNNSVTSGLSLRVGGDGMKAAYDQRIPSIAKKIAKATGAMMGKVGLKGATQSDSEGTPIPEVTPEQMHKAAKGIKDQDARLFWPEPEDAGYDDSSDEEEVERYKSVGRKFNGDVEDIASILETGDVKNFGDLQTVIRSMEDTESNFLDGDITIRLGTIICRAFGWDALDFGDSAEGTDGLVKALKEYDERVLKAKGGVEVWYLELNPQVKDMVAKGMRMTFESVQPKAKPSKPWWEV